VFGLLPAIPEANKPLDGNAWKQNALALLDEVVYFRGAGVTAPTHPGKHAWGTSNTAAVGCETLPLFLNGSALPPSRLAEHLPTLVEAVNTLELLKVDRQVVAAVARSLLTAIESEQIEVGQVSVRQSHT
jgi:hypothetical protein